VCVCVVQIKYYRYSAETMWSVEAVNNVGGMESEVVDGCRILIVRIKRQSEGVNSTYYNPGDQVSPRGFKTWTQQCLCLAHSTHDLA